MRDRSLTFPVYSGLFFLLKFGGMVKPNEALGYELNLVSNFVEETRLHGDPVHYLRSLSMMGEFFSRQGQYEDALSCHEKVKMIYNVKEHSALLVEIYASDRAAQNFGGAANCLYRLGRVEESLELSFLVLDNMMPQMDLKNVHNSIWMIYPILWILKNEKMIQKAASALKCFVFEPFHKYFGVQGKTFSLEVFRPLEALFSVLLFIEGNTRKIDNTLISWVLQPNSLNISKGVDNSMANIGRCGSSICAELCLLLSKLSQDQYIVMQLVEKGWKLAQIAMKTANLCGAHQTAYFETKPVYEELLTLFKKYNR